MSEPGRGGEGGLPDRRLVIGYGNSLRSDDGVGLRVAELLVDDPRFEGVEVLARHQLTPELVVDLAAAAAVVYVDADVEGAPGEISVRRLEPTAASGSAGGPAPERGASSHHVGVEELLELTAELAGRRPAATLVSVGVATMELGEGLSPEVEASLRRVALVIAELLLDQR